MPVIMGTHGAGVGVPMAAAVAAITAGLAGQEHIPKDFMLIIGIASVIVPTGILPIKTPFGKKVSAEGATPNEHVHIPPLMTLLLIV